MPTRSLARALFGFGRAADLPRIGLRRHQAAETHHRRRRSSRAGAPPFRTTRRARSDALAGRAVHPRDLRSANALSFASPIEADSRHRAGIGTRRAVAAYDARHGRSRRSVCRRFHLAQDAPNLRARVHGRRFRRHAAESDRYHDLSIGAPRRSRVDPRSLGLRAGPRQHPPARWTLMHAARSVGSHDAVRINLTPSQNAQRLMETASRQSYPQ